MMQKIQRLGGAMFTPALLFAFFGIMVALTKILTDPMIVGSIANEGTGWFNFWMSINSGSWTVFNQIELLFVMGLPISLAKKASARAVMESVVIYLVFNYFVSGLLSGFGSFFGVDFSQEVGGTSGLKMIAGIKTFDTNIVGAIIISAIVVWLHNRYFDKKVPEYLGIFKGSALVVAYGFFLMIPVALAFCLFWPKVQLGISSMQSFLLSTGAFGMWLTMFLVRVLIPTGLHHFIANPMLYGPVLVKNGVVAYWLDHVGSFANSGQSLATLFPQGGFTMDGNGKIFGSIGIALAFYATANKDKKKQTLGILVPVALTAALCGITEPIDFTFLFVAPLLYVVHSALVATMGVIMFKLGISGSMDSGLINMAARNWLPLGKEYWATYLLQIAIGIIFIAIYFVIFRYLILKFNLKTPGREDSAIVKLFNKKDYQDKKNKQVEDNSVQAGNDDLSQQAAIYLKALGGSENIADVTNCATRLRVNVKDEKKVDQDNATFQSAGAHGVVRNGKAFQIIVGLDVPEVREDFEQLMNQDETSK